MLSFLLFCCCCCFKSNCILIIYHVIVRYRYIFASISLKFLSDCQFKSQFKKSNSICRKSIDTLLHVHKILLLDSLFTSSPRVFFICCRVQMAHHLIAATFPELFHFQATSEAVISVQGTKYRRAGCPFFISTRTTNVRIMPMA